MVGVYDITRAAQEPCTHREFHGNEIHVAASGKRIRQRQALLARNLLASELPDVAPRQRKFIRRLLTVDPLSRCPRNPPPLSYLCLLRRDGLFLRGISR